MKKWGERALLVSSAVLIVSCLASCQAVFTYSPLSFLKRDPATLGAAQQLAYARAALASGDRTSVAAAYAAIAAAAAADTGNSELQYTAAQLALELSGVGDAFTGLLSGLAGGGVDPLTLTTEIFDGIIMADLIAATGYLGAAEAAGADLTATDYLVGAVGLVIEGSGGGDLVGTIADNPNQDEALRYLEAGVAELPEGDPAQALLQSLLDSLGGGA